MVTSWLTLYILLRLRLWVLCVFTICFLSKANKIFLIFFRPIYLRMLKFHMLSQWCLSAIAFPTFFQITVKLSNNLTCCPSHSFSFFLMRLSINLGHNKSHTCMLLYLDYSAYLSYVTLARWARSKLFYFNNLWYYLLYISS